jgi:hypothetical protein
MADGGFVIKFDGKKAERCYRVTFDYDEGTYAINDGEPRSLPKELKEIMARRVS